MKRNSFLLFFVGFYLLTAMSGTQFRTERAARRVAAHATQDVRIQVGDPNPQAIDSYPRFREAKKAGFLDFGQSSGTILPPTHSDRDFHAPPDSSHSLLVAEIISGRGPPVLL